MQRDPHRILVVDDNPATLYSTGRVLKAAGFEVITAMTGAQAVESASANEPDLIVLDVNLPDFDGFEVVRRIRSLPRIARIPIIHLSATFVQDAYKVQGLEGGANGYLTHPVEPPVLVASINAFLRTREAEDAMRRSEDRVQAIFDRALHGIALLDQAFIFVDINPAMCRMLGRSQEECVGKHASTLCPEGYENSIAHIAATVSREGAWRGELPLLRSDGTRVELEWSISRHSEPDLRLAIVTDVTERLAAAAEHERLLQRESAARDEAERANRLKDEFLATLSHELRSPLNAIVGWTQVLQRRAVDGGLRGDELTDALTVIERNARLQSQLVAELLDVSRITSGKMRLEIAPLDPTGPLKAAIEGVRPAADAKQISLELDLDHFAGPVLGDAGRLQQVFWNLLSNAVKFTPREGKVWVRLARENSLVTVSVRDTGCGINPDFVPFVFDRFRQENPSTQRNYGGLGIGLAIVRHLVEMHGGTVLAASEGQGRGATFTVNLPLCDPRAVRRLGTTERGGSTATLRARPPTNLVGLRVLIVEDEADARELLTRVLSDLGAEVHAASGTAQALRLAAQTSPRILVSDIGMPGEDGYSLIRTLRDRGFSGAELYAIAVTALASTEDRKKALAAGYDNLFVKPIDIEALLDALASIQDSTSATS